MLKHPFWSRQPVFHFHKAWLWFMTDQVITQEFTVIKKYYDTDHISHYNSYDFPKEYTSGLVDFIKEHYLREKNIDYIPNEDGIMKYFVGHNERISICLYKNDDKLQGVLTARPLNVSFNTHKQIETGYGRRKKLPKQTITNTNKMTINYVDYLCVHKEHRKQNISPKLIHTYAIQTNKEHRKNERCDSVYLFKREGKTTAYVPLVAYKAYYYDLKYWNDNTAFPKPYELMAITGSNKSLLIDNLSETSINTKFDCVIMNNLGNLTELIDAGIILPYIIHNKGDIVCVYFFRNGFVYYNDAPILDCIGSILFYPEFREFFELGVVKAIVSLKDTYKYLNIECLGHNDVLMNHINKKHDVLHSEWYTYYLFNYVKRPYLSNQIFILN